MLCVGFVYCVGVLYAVGEFYIVFGRGGLGVGSLYIVWGLCIPGGSFL